VLVCVLRVLVRIPKVTIEHHSLCSSQDVAPLCTVDFNENLWQTDRPRAGQCMLCSLLQLTSFLSQMLTNISVADNHSLEHMSVLYQCI